jgi:hypothetical protein
MSDREVDSASVVRFGRISVRTVALLFGVAFVPLAVILYSVSNAESARKTWREACLAPGNEKIDVTGVVRLRQGGFYLEAGTSLFYLGKSCDGRYGRACLESNPGKRLLTDHIGQLASASLCDGEVLSYQVTGTAFYK